MQHGCRTLCVLDSVGDGVALARELCAAALAQHPSRFRKLQRVCRTSKGLIELSVRTVKHKWIKNNLVGMQLMHMRSWAAPPYSALLPVPYFRTRSSNACVY